MALSAMAYHEGVMIMVAGAQRLLAAVTLHIHLRFLRWQELAKANEPLQPLS